MRVLVACEYSGRVRDAFLAAGHDAMSCDLRATEIPGPHHRGDVRDILTDGWDLMIAHPPCTHLAVSGARHFARKQSQGTLWGADPQTEALEFVRILLTAPIPRIALENPVSVISSVFRPADQTIQPWQYGHGETKATCLWLKNLPPLTPTNVVDGRAAVVHMMPPGPDRWLDRSRTYTGIAAAMAAQWGPLDPPLPGRLPPLDPCGLTLPVPAVRGRRDKHARTQTVRAGREPGRVFDTGSPITTAGIRPRTPRLTWRYRRGCSGRAPGCTYTVRRYTGEHRLSTVAGSPARSPVPGGLDAHPIPWWRGGWLDPQRGTDRMPKHPGTLRFDATPETVVMVCQHPECGWRAVTLPAEANRTAAGHVLAAHPDNRVMVNQVRRRAARHG